MAYMGIGHCYCLHALRTIWEKGNVENRFKKHTKIWKQVRVAFVNFPNQVPLTEQYCVEGYLDKVRTTNNENNHPICRPS